MPSQRNGSSEGNRKPVRKSSQLKSPSQQRVNQKRTVSYSPKRNTHKLYMRQAAVSFGLVCMGITTFCGLQAMSVVLLLQGRIDQAIATSAGGVASNFATGHARQINKEAQARLARASKPTQRKQSSSSRP